MTTSRLLNSLMQHAEISPFVPRRAYHLALSDVCRAYAPTRTHQVDFGALRHPVTLRLNTTLYRSETSTMCWVRDNHDAYMTAAGA